MDVNEHISSGNLELYVAGVLSESENLIVHGKSMEHSEILSEIEAIEASVLALTKAASPGLPLGFDIVKDKINIDNKIADKEIKLVDLKQKDINWSWYLGWAASLLLAVGFYWMYTQNLDLKSQIEVAEKENQKLQQQIADSDISLEKSQELLSTIRDKNIAVVELAGQTVSPSSYAKAYWNRELRKVFIDAQGLPEPPDGFVYQVWCLQFNPLTPTSIGLLDNFKTDENKIFALDNAANASEGFGITLEPKGGSESPNLDQLYTLGAVSIP